MLERQSEAEIGTVLAEPRTDPRGNNRQRRALIPNAGLYRIGRYLNVAVGVVAVSPFVLEGASSAGRINGP